MKQYIITNTYSSDLWNDLADDGILWLIPHDNAEEHVIQAQSDGWIRRNTIVWVDEDDIMFVYFLVKQPKYHFNPLYEKRVSKPTNKPHQKERGLKKGDVSYAKGRQQCHGPNMRCDDFKRKKRCVWFCNQAELIETIKECSETTEKRLDQRSFLNE